MILLILFLVYIVIVSFTAGDAAFGTAFKLGATTIARVTNISGPSLSVDTEDVTSHDSIWEEVVPTILRSGEIKLELNYDPDGVTHYATANTGFLHAMINKTDVTTYTLVFPNGEVYSFAHAFVVGFEPAMPVGGAITGTVTIKPSGVVTVP